jgi:tetratricopeptide (TPR) repeat protein
MIEHSISKVHILIQQKKFAVAEQVLRSLLAKDPNSVYYLSLLAEVNLQQGRLPAAMDIIDDAIGLSPVSPYLFYIKSRIAIQQEQLDAAETCLQQAIALDPFDASYFALLSRIKLIRKQYQAALELADQALSIDAENLLALNMRSTALLKLNKSEASFGTIEGALRKDPGNAFTHTNYGWGLLEKGDHKKALTHFREALKLSPDSEYAQAGMVEALKAGNFFYRLFLKYAFFMGNLTARYQWRVVAGFFLVQLALMTLADSVPVLEPYLLLVITLLALCAFSTWIITPVSNLFLRFNAYGKFLLGKKEKISSNFVAASFATCITGAVLFVAMADKRYLSIALFGFVMMVPLSKLFASVKYKRLFLLYTAAMLVVGIAAIARTFVTGHVLNGVTAVFAVGFAAFQWMANFFIGRENNR